MEYSLFMKLCTMISPKILVNDEMAQRRTCKEGITIEIMLDCLLRWLVVGSYLDIRLSAGISQAHFYTSVYKCMDAIKNCLTNFQTLRRNWKKLHRVLS